MASAWTTEDILAKISEIALDTFGLKLVDYNAPIKDAGLDSMAIIDIVMGLEEHFGCSLALEKLPRDPTLHDFVSLVEASTAG